MHKNESNQIQHEMNCLNRVINEMSFESLYGFSEESYDLFMNEIKSANLNQQNNDFPDLITNNGFIEHFQVTSSPENKKGSLHKIKEITQKKNHEKKLNDLARDDNVVSTVLDYHSHSYHSLKQSFKKNFEKHFKRIQSYSGIKDTGIFLIEYDDLGALSMGEIIDFNFEEGIFIGDIKIEPETFHNYRLSRDKFLLEYLADYSEDIKFVIFLSEKIEIFDTNKINYYLSFIPNDYCIAPNITKSSIRSIKI
ncbi:hypothetical protein ITX49_05775 [Enterococcus casseliflavus]|uniref:hypothetical protein n=1 Tax=Enterococcus casseliflavus TaxID=37734 RepID=UPI00129C7E03|nr:hypothetical protein [Enterococcus casseliflavus]MBZ3640679.1 hypothetical protein [Enterococcus casseliflavus]MRI70755.1 hypothetical protein [Enterococcus casseliflavus]